MAGSFVVPSDEAIETAIRDFLDNNQDLEALTAKMVRKSLEDKFAVDLTSKKKTIDNLLMTLLNERDNAISQQPEEKNGATNGASSSSQHLDNSSNDTDDSDHGLASSHSPPRKKHKKNKKTSSDEDEEEQQHDVLEDEAMARKLQHEEMGMRSTRRTTRRPVVEKKPRKKKEKSGPKKNSNSIYARECILSDELAAVMGTDRLARKDVVSRMWQIFKERNIMDPNNKRYVLCDEQLEKVFKVKKFKAFGMMKILKNHIFDAHHVAETSSSLSRSRSTGGYVGGYVVKTEQGGDEDEEEDDDAASSSSSSEGRAL